jgi:hypothetical protein
LRSCATKSDRTTRLGRHPDIRRGAVVPTQAGRRSVLAQRRAVAGLLASWLPDEVISLLPRGVRGRLVSRVRRRSGRSLRFDGAPRARDPKSKQHGCGRRVKPDPPGVVAEASGGSRTLARPLASTGCASDAERHISRLAQHLNLLASKMSRLAHCSARVAGRGCAIDGPILSVADRRRAPTPATSPAGWHRRGALARGRS